MSSTDAPVTPEEFMDALHSLRASDVRPEVALNEIPAPRGVAPFSVALEGHLADFALTTASANLPRDFDLEDYDLEDIVSGKFVLLHDPAGQDVWQGNFRVVIHVRAMLDQDLASDPLLTDVVWSWLNEAFEFCGTDQKLLAGTITRTVSVTLGEIHPAQQQAEVEIRASWSPQFKTTAGRVEWDLGPHLAAWSNLICAAIGLPVVGEGFPARKVQRGPQSIVEGL